MHATAASAAGVGASSMPHSFRPSAMESELAAEIFKDDR